MTNCELVYDTDRCFFSVLLIISSSGVRSFSKVGGFSKKKLTFFSALQKYSKDPMLAEIFCAAAYFWKKRSKNDVRNTLYKKKKKMHVVFKQGTTAVLRG